MELTAPFKSRIAPTPSGYLHIGNVYNFVLTWLMAKKEGGTVWLRIDDLDQERVRGEYLEDIFRVLDVLGLVPDEGPSGVEDFRKNYSQLHRMPHYHALLKQLVQGQAVFACDCTRKKIQELAFDRGYPEVCADKKMKLEKPNCVWRLHTELLAEVTFQEWGKGLHTQKLPVEMRDFVVRKKDKFPAYQLASLADDTAQGVSFVVRGKDLQDSTMAQIYLAKVLGLNNWGKTVFFHHPLVESAKGHKLSKSAGNAAKSSIMDDFGSRAAIFEALSQMPHIPAGKYKSLREMLEAFEGI